MERSPHAAKVLIGAAILLVAVVAAVLIARSGGGDDSGGADAISTDTSVKPDVPAQSGPPPSGAFAEMAEGRLDQLCHRRRQHARRRRMFERQ